MELFLCREVGNNCVVGITFLDQYTFITTGWDPMFIAAFDHDGKTICASALRVVTI
ncbi:MAG: hypothetical protein IPN88_17585 [Bacteroidetes bacterium]|nr:hypothetical protein [Bacteroidota bacterium]